ncbi:MAG: cbb3-type cytochrome c oxidase subunit I [Gemmatimonadaceae bacterium]
MKAFLKASLAWLALGVTLGVAMAAHPVWTVFRAAHMHMVLLGFVTMMIYGVAYHVIPRFTGFPLHNRRAAGVHWWLSNVGLALMSCGFIERVFRAGAGTFVLATGGVLSAAGAYVFVYLIWRTVDGPVAMRKAAERARSLATIQAR